MGAGGIIILKNVKSALTVGLSQSGNPKLWHALIVSHGVVWALGHFL